MKKTFWTMWLLVAAGVGFVACRGGDAEGFETADLPADSLTVEGFSGYTSWMRQGDKVVVYTLPGDTNFSVYRLPEFEPLYDFAVEPRKPGSFFYAAGLFPDGVQDSVLYVFSLQERFLSRVLLGEDTVGSRPADCHTGFGKRDSPLPSSRSTRLPSRSYPAG